MSGSNPYHLDTVDSADQLNGYACYFSRLLGHHVFYIHLSLEAEAFPKFEVGGVSMIVSLQILLLLACLIILGFQLMLLRQIGLIHSRLRTLDDPREKPMKTEIRSLRMLDGTDWILAESSTTFCILLSTTCNHCRPILERLSNENFGAAVFIGLSASNRESALDACDTFHLSPSRVFIVRNLQNELNLNEFPGYIVLDENGNILERRPVFAWKYLHTAFISHKINSEEVVANN